MAPMPGVNPPRTAVPNHWQRAARVAHILVVDDEALVRTLLENILRRAGYRVTSGSESATFHAAMEAGDVDLVLLDLRLGREHGFDLARAASERYEVPVIFVTGDGNVNVKVTGFELGAEDYITKPFDPRELLARVRVALRHRSESTQLKRLRFGGFLLDMGAMELTAPDDTPVELTGMEMQVLIYLVQRPGQAVTRDDISREIRGRAHDPQDRTIDVIVSKVRRKLQQASDDGWDPIHTIRGIGYKFIAGTEPA